MKLYAITLILGAVTLGSLTYSCKSDRVGIQPDTPEQIAGPNQVLLKKITSTQASESFQFVDAKLSKVIVDNSGVLAGEYNFFYNQGILSKIIKSEPNTSNSITWIPIYAITNKLTSLQFIENTNSISYTGNIDITYGAENQIIALKLTKTWILASSVTPISYNSTLSLSWIGLNVNKITYTTSPNSTPILPSGSVQVPTDGIWEASGFDSKKNTMRAVPRIWIVLKSLENPVAAFGNSQNNPTGWIYTPNGIPAGSPVSASYTYGNLDYPVTATIGGVLFTFTYQ